MRASLARVPTYSQGLVAVNDNEKAEEGSAILRVLGQIEGAVQAMREDIIEIKADARDDRAKTSESRSRMAEKVEDLTLNLQKTNSTVKVLGQLVDKQGKDIASLAPKVEATAATVRNWTIRGGLVLGALAAVGGTLWWAITNYGVALWRFLDQFIPKG